jgi:hypothetical protein
MTISIIAFYLLARAPACPVHTVEVSRDEVAHVLVCRRVSELTLEEISGLNDESLAKLSAEDRRSLETRRAILQKVRDNGEMSERAAELVTILQVASDELRLPKGPVGDREREKLNCQAFFREIGKQLAKRHEESWVDDFPNMQADQIATRIAELARKGDKWEKLVGGNEAVLWSRAQKLANQGVVVIGASTADSSGFGHLGIVVPVPRSLEESRFDGRGPFVRDGNEHKPSPFERVYPSTHGAVKASKAFAVSQTSWYVWMSSKK